MSESASQVHGPDFEAVLEAFLNAYRPVLERELKLSESPRALVEASQERPPTVEDEIAVARELFERFFTPEIATRALPDEGRAAFGELEEWDWCYRLILCCLLFGWLVCRGPRTFRGFGYYAYRYWWCVREALGEPLSEPLTQEQKRDFATLVGILGKAYAPQIQGQIKDLDYPVDVLKGIESGAIGWDVDDSLEDGVFERLMTAEGAAALLGPAWRRYGEEAISRACRCYAVAALEFGCCLARARTLFEALECLELFFVDLRRCFAQIIAELDMPPACSTLTFVAACSNLAGIEITGTAAGSAFTSYALSYMVSGSTDNTAVVYPDCSRPPANPSSSTPVSSGVLGYLDVTLLPPATTQVTVFLDVYGSGGLHQQVSVIYQLEIDAIDISAVAKVQTFVGQDPFNGSPSIIKMVQNPITPTLEQSVGGSISITGSAYAYGCGSQMTQYQLALFGPTAPGATPLPAPTPSPTALGGTPIIAPVVYDGTPAHPWSSGCFFGFQVPNTILNGDLVASWSTDTCWDPFPPPGHSYTIPAISSNETWASAPSGRYVIFLEVDEGPIPSPHTPVTPAGEDQVAVWIDNFPVVGAITQIGDVIGCGDLHLKDFVGKTCPVIGIAWDYPINVAAAQMVPNDNFGSYALAYQKNGGSPVAFLASDYTPNGAPAGTPPNVRVPNLWQAVAPTPAQAGVLASWDIVTALDGGPQDPSLPPCIAANPAQLPRGCRCAYVIVLTAVDTTRVGDGGDRHGVEILFAINVINDIGT
jgi:hypothetical protein